LKKKRSTIPSFSDVAALFQAKYSKLGSASIAATIIFSDPNLPRAIQYVTRAQLEDCFISIEHQLAFQTSSIVIQQFILPRMMQKQCNSTYRVHCSPCLTRVQHFSNSHSLFDSRVDPFEK
jgi:hypothetical protein